MSLRDIQERPGGVPGLGGSKESVDPRWLKVAFLFLAGLAVVYVVFMVLLSNPPFIDHGLSAGEVLEVARSEPITQDFISKNPDFDVNITFLTAKDIMSLSNRYPAIYGDLPDEGIYRVEYSSHTDPEGVLLLIDLDKKVLKYYRVRSMSLTA